MPLLCFLVMKPSPPSAPPEKRFRPGLYITAFILTTLIFIFGILIGHQFTAAKLNQLDGLQQELHARTLGAELQTLLLTEFPCTSFNSTLTEELFDVGSKLDYMEGQLGKNNKEVLSLKEYYSLLEIRHWLLLRLAKDRCGTGYDLVLYFYSNLGDCGACEQQGSVLSTLHKKYPRLNIYSFDLNIPNPALQTVKRIFGITKAPALVANNKVIDGFRNKNQLEELLFGNQTKMRTDEMSTGD